jgi:hypothetical protein
MKILALMFILLLFIADMASAFTPIAPGGEIIVPAGQPGAGTVIASMSRKVLGNIISASDTYALVLKHLLGTREFATSTAGTKIYFKIESAAHQNTEEMDLNLSHSTTEDFSTWNNL